MTSLLLMEICGVACYWAWDYASPAKRRKRAIMRRIRGTVADPRARKWAAGALIFLAGALTAAYVLMAWVM